MPKFCRENVEDGRGFREDSGHCDLFVYLKLASKDLLEILKR